MVRQQALLHPHHPDAVELQPLRRMEGHQAEHVALRLVRLETLRLRDVEHEVIEESTDHHRKVGRSGCVRFFGRTLMVGQRVDHLLHAGPASLLLRGIVLVFLLEKAAIADQLQQCPQGLARAPRRRAFPQRDYPLECHHAGRRRGREPMGVAGGEQFLPEAVARGGACIASSLYRRSGEAPRGHVGDP